MAKCAVCGKETETAKYCSLCGEMIGDCCRHKVHTRAWAATKAAGKRVREAYGALLKRAS